MKNKYVTKQKSNEKRNIKIATKNFTLRIENL